VGGHVVFVRNALHTSVEVVVGIAGQAVGFQIGSAVRSNVPTERQPARLTGTAVLAAPRRARPCSPWSAASLTSTVNSTVNGRAPPGALGQTRITPTSHRSGRCRVLPTRRSRTRAPTITRTQEASHAAFLLPLDLASCRRNSPRYLLDRKPYSGRPRRDISSRHSRGERLLEGWSTGSPARRRRITARPVAEIVAVFMRYSRKAA
jgi:hypothetical protein